MARNESAETQDYVSSQDMEVDIGKRLEELGVGGRVSSGQAHVRQDAQRERLQVL